MVLASTRRRALVIALPTGLVVEVVGGFALGSLAVLADAVHMISDVVALALAYAALRIASRPPTERHTFGFGRTEVLVAEANAVLLLLGAIVVAVEAVRRLADPVPIDGWAVAIIGALGLVVNLGSAIIVGRHAGHNRTCAVWHLAAGRWFVA
jgi:cobalt-zinc-cadmium efflux system protein